MASSAAAVLAALLLPVSLMAFCPIDYQECTNGMFNPTTCQCDCIPPYCPDASGDCLNPTGFCGGNPWASCTRGLDCPWWPNPLKAESCTTGNAVPAGIWSIHHSLEFCCKVNFPYSNVCYQVETTTTTTTTSTTTTSTAPELESISLKFTLMGLPSRIDDIGPFKEYFMEEFKSIVTNVANDIGMKVTNIQEVYDLTHAVDRGVGRELQASKDFASKATQTVHLYYDVEVVKDSSQRYGPELIEQIRGEHYQTLTDLQEYSDADGYYYMSNFDICTTSSAGSSSAEFDLCTLDHQVVKVKFSASNLDPSLDRDELDDELLKIYTSVLNGIEGLTLTDITLDRVAETSYGTDIYFNVGVIKSDGADWKNAIETELKKEAARQEILDEVQKYTVKTMKENGEPVDNVNWCFDNQGMFSMNCSVAVNSSLALPMWAIITIASTAAAILLCIFISCCICSWQNQKDDDDIKYNVQSFVADPEQWRQVNIDGQKKHRSAAATPRRQRRNYHDERHHGRERRRSIQRYTRSFRRPKRRSSYRRSHSPRRRERRPSRKQERRRTQEPHSDEEMQMLALPPPQYEYVEPYYPELPQGEELMALPAPDDYYDSNAALYVDDEEVNRPDPPMLEGPTAIEQQQQQQEQNQTNGMLMLTDGRARSDSSGGMSGPYLAIEPDGFRESEIFEYGSESDSSSSYGYGKRR